MTPPAGDPPSGGGFREGSDGVPAFLLSLAVFGYWLVVGSALPLALGCRRDAALRTVLVAPALGMAVTALPLFWANRWGVPVAAAAPPLSLALLAAALAVLVRRRSVFGLQDSGGRAAARRYGAFALMLVAAMALAGWPMARAGFDWLSFGSDDMANYVLGADRLLRHGFFTMPPLAGWTSGGDLPSLTWTMHVGDGARFGSELMLAWLSAVTGLYGFQVFMPMMVALHGALIAATAALVLAEAGSAVAALAAAAVLAVNPLTVFGSVSQLIAQTGGFALVAAALTLLRAPWELSRERWPAYVLPAAAVLAVFLVWYPEASPFLGAGLLLYLAANHRLWRPRAGALAALLLILAAAVIAFSGRYFLDAVGYLWIQYSASTEASAVRSMVFPYYLLPSGLSTFWGLQPLALSHQPPFQTLAVLAGGLLSVAAVAVTALSVLRGRIAACVTAVMLAVTALLLAKGMGFGLYKIAMYLQPSLVATLAVFLAADAGPWPGRRWPRLAGAAVAGLVLLCQLGTSLFYTRVASDANDDPYYFSLKGGTPIHLVSQMARIAAGTAAPAFATDAPTLTTAKMVGYFTRGHPLRFLSASPFDHLLGSRFAPGSAELRLHDDFLGMVTRGRFLWRTTGEDDAMEFFPADRVGAGDDFTLIRMPAVFSILNGRSRGADPGLVELAPRASLADTLVFKPTTLGADAFAATDFGRVAIWAMEPDYFFPGHRLAAVGRHLVFRVIDPEPAPRLVLEMSASQHINGHTELPPAAVVGGGVVPLGFTGRGSARVFSEPVTFQEIFGERYLGIDMGVPSTLAVSTAGVDPRKLVGLVRDVSLISERDYRALRPPREVSRFPADLADRQLEYSGLYEDGWLSDAAFFRLAGSAEPVTLRLDLQIPRFGPASPPRELTVLADGRPVLRRTLEPGESLLSLPLPASGPTRRIDLRFGATEPLPGGDGRPVAARLLRLGWHPPGAAPGELVIGRDSLESVDVDPAGLWRDGWLAGRAELTLAGGGAGRLRLRAMLPAIADPGVRVGLTVTVNGETAGRAELAPGDIDLAVPVPASAAPRRIVLSFSRTQTLPAPDLREASVLLKSIGLAASE